MNILYQLVTFLTRKYYLQNSSCVKSIVLITMNISFTSMPKATTRVKDVKYGLQYTSGYLFKPGHFSKKPKIILLTAELRI